MPTIAEKLEALREHYGNTYKLAFKLDWPPFLIEEWLEDECKPSNGAQDAINRLYDELKEGE